MDARTSGTASGVNPYLGTVDKEHRPRYDQGQAEVRTERLQGREGAEDCISADAAGCVVEMRVARQRS